MEERRKEQDRRAAERCASRTEARTETKALLKTDGLRAANPDERVQLREQRLAEYYEAGAPRAVYVGEAALVTGAGDAAWAGREPGRGGASRMRGQPLLERVIGSADFLGVRYLLAGAAAQRAVAHVVIRAPGGVGRGSGTGFLVSPRLLLTNNHVLATPEEASASHLVFNYQDGLDGRPMPTRDFGFRPDVFWITDEALDFTLVAVDATEEQLRPFGYYPLIAEQGKAIKGECLTIVQHPAARPKEIAIRNNQIVDLLPHFIHYETDTEPGASGSPGTNDQWEVVALHHASVPRKDGDGFVNEGVRVSSIVKAVRAARLDSDEQRRLREQLLDGAARHPWREAEHASAAPSHPQAQGGAAAASLPPAGARTADAGASRALAASAGGASITVPLEITIRLGDIPQTASAARGGALVAEGGQGADEAISIDPDYSTRRGYDAGFLGQELAVPLPELTPEMLRRTARNRDARGGPEHVLPYHHFSVVMNAARRLAWLTAVNIDGTRTVKVERGSDRWIADPRIGSDEQTDSSVYASNPLDRGHLVRRLDPAWGDERTATAANDDTFHFSNCAPQHARFNQNQTTWAGLENYVLHNTDNRDLRVSVFTGPVLDDVRDIPYRGIQLPLEFWKVVVMARRSGELSATAYLLSQASLLDGLERVAVRADEFQFGAYRTFQVPIERIQRLTGLRFGGLSRFDPLGGLESGGDARRAIDTLEQIRL